MMGRFWQFFTQTLRGRLLLLTSLPLVLLTVLLTVKTVIDERVEVKREYHDLGSTAATYLAATSDFALYSGNAKLLGILAKSMSELPQVDGVTFLNSSRQVLASTFKGQAPWPELLPTSIGLESTAIGNRLYFERPVSISGIELEDYVDTAPLNGELGVITGWVIIAIDLSAMEVERQAILIRNGSTAVGLLVLVLLLSYALGSGILRGDGSRQICQIT